MRYSLNYPFSYSPICLISYPLFHPPTQTSVSVYPLNSHSLNHPTTRQYKHPLTQVLYSDWLIMINVFTLPPKEICSIFHRGSWRLKLRLLFFPTDLRNIWTVLYSVIFSPENFCSNRIVRYLFSEWTVFRLTTVSNVVCCSFLRSHTEP
jgi:hypothetical protein